MEMEVEEIRACKKRSRIGNGSKIGFEREEEEGGEGRSRLRNWHHPSSRVIRVSRASGGKDRHSKVLTSKGLRDRRVRLSVPTAIQFYDLQDRLGYEQPSKAIEWLIKAADAAIAELPSLDTSFPTSLKLQNPIQERPSIAEGQHLSTKSGCSSNSETSKGSILSLSRPESRVKARDRGRERAKEKSRDDVHFATHHQNLNPNLNSQSSFTELLTGGTSNGAAGTNFDPQKQIRQLPSTSTADYFGQAGVFGHQQKTHQSPSGFSSQAHFGNSTSIGMVPFNIAAAAAAATDHPELQQFSFLQDHYIPVAAVAAGGDYSLNFSISSGLAGFNRGTLQSNAPSQLPHHHHHHHHHHLQRLSPPVDSTNLPLFFGAAAPTTSSAASGENQLSAGFDGRLELCYNDGYRHSDIKGKAKS